VASRCRRRCRRPSTGSGTRVVLNAPRRLRACKKAKLRVRLAGVGTGSVVIRDGRKVVRTVTVKGRATVKRRLKPGKHRLSASCAGSATGKPATSAVGARDLSQSTSP
jgi:hypothetical protein